MAGQKEVLERFKLKMDEIKGVQTEAAITTILIQISTNTAPMVPIDTSNLINSEFRRTMQTTTGWSGEIGYGAEYALAVHNAPGTLKGEPREDFGMTSNRSEFGPVIPKAFGGGTGTGNYWDPDAEPRFLEKGAKQFIDENQIQAIFQREFKL